MKVLVCLELCNTFVTRILNVLRVCSLRGCFAAQTVLAQLTPGFPLPTSVPCSPRQREGAPRAQGTGHLWVPAWRGGRRNSQSYLQTTLSALAGKSGVRCGRLVQSRLTCLVYSIFLSTRCISVCSELPPSAERGIFPESQGISGIVRLFGFLACI